MEQMDSKKRQDAVDYHLFERPEALKKFADAWKKNVLDQQAEGVQLNLWLPDRKAKSRAMFLGEELKMLRKAPLDQGIKTLEEKKEELI